MRLKVEICEFTRDGGWNLSITFYTLLLTRILIYPPRSVNGIIGSSVFNNNLFEINMKKER
jgi:hypothetical protein